MANSPQARKRARQNEKRRLHNGSLRSSVRTSIKKVLSAVASGDHSAAKTAFQAAEPIIDKMVNKGILHKNTAARYKSRLNSKVKKLASA